VRACAETTGVRKMASFDQSIDKFEQSSELNPPVPRSMMDKDGSEAARASGGVPVPAECLPCHEIRNIGRDPRNGHELRVLGRTYA
jgi:hypothetical protein